jgi:putative ABC transport system permease protein
MKFSSIKEYFYLALRNLRSRSLRSWLTIFGIVIGVFLIVSLISLSEGLQKTVMTQLKMMGGDLIFVMPGEMSEMMVSLMGGMELKDDEIKAIEKARGVEEVVVFPYAAEVARYEGEAKIAFLGGVSFDKASFILREDMGWQTIEGDFPVSGKREVLIGSLVSKEVFPGIKVGDELIIKGKKFQVSGVLMSLGSKQDDSMIALDIDDFRAITGKKEGTPMAIVKADPSFGIERVVQNIEISLEEVSKRRVKEDAPAYSVITSETVSDMVGGIVAILQIVVFAFASIALLVGGIGIMNTMYTSVRERTREIGIMKAVGARNFAVLSIFLFEAGIIGIIGGAGGTLLGIIFAKSIEVYGQIHPMLYIQASVSPGLILFGLAFSLLVGCLSGFFPARKAARLRPVDALRRHE